MFKIGEGYRDEYEWVWEQDRESHSNSNKKVGEDKECRKEWECVL